MKQLLAVILCCLLTVPVYGAFGAATVWWVDGSAGADTNGGGFDSGVVSPGTDESGTAVAITVTLTGTTTGTCLPLCTSTTHGPGNFIHIASGTGCTFPAWYEILSQTTGTITVDHAMGVSTDACVGTIGGNLASIGVAGTRTVSQNNICVKDDATYSVSAGITVATGGAVGTLSSIQGYHTTCGVNGSSNDAGNCTIVSPGTGCVTIQATSGTNYTLLTSQANTSVSNFIIDCNSRATTTGFLINASGLEMDNVLVKNCATRGIQIQAGSNTITRTRVTGGLAACTAGINIGGNSAIVGVVVDANNCPGVVVGNNAFICINSVSVNNVGASSDGFQLNVTTTNAVALINCAGYTNGRDDFRFTNIAALGDAIIRNSIGWGSTGKSFNSSASTFTGAVTLNYNAYASGSLSGMTAGPNDVTLTADPFTNGASLDFSLNSAVGGGAALKAKGFPGVVAGSTGYISIGPIQPNPTGGTTVSGAYGFVQ